MIGRVDDQLKRVAEAQNITVPPGVVDWAGIAVFKHTHALFQQRGLPGWRKPSTPKHYPRRDDEPHHWKGLRVGAVKMDL